MHAFVLQSFDLPWMAAITDSVVSNVLLLLISLLLVNTLQYYIPQADRYIMLLAWVLALTIIWLLLSKLILSFCLSESQYLLFQKQSLFIRFSFGFLITSTIVLISVLWYNWQEQKTLEERRRETEHMAKEAELFKLRQQLQPHFLFNSLNSISALIGPEGKAARKMVLQLSEFLRGTLKKEEHQWTTLGEELRYLQLYLEIEKVRFGHRLQTAFEIAEETQQLQLPALLLQPVVENAIKFGLYDTIDDITITITTYQQNQTLIVEVQNPYDPEITTARGTGFGLLSIRRRLYLLFGRNDLLQTEASEKLFTTRLTIPQLLNKTA